MKLRRGRKAISVVFVASIAAASMGVMALPLRVEAAAPVLTIPGRLYPAPGQVLAFDKSEDPVSGAMDNREIKIEGLTPGPLGCNPIAPDYVDDDCPGVDLSLNTTKAGLLHFDGITINALDLSQPADGVIDLLYNPDDKVVVTATDSHGKDSTNYTLRGPAAGVTQMLDALQLVPCAQQVGTLKVPAPPAGENPYEVDCGDQFGDPTLEPPYEERESADGLLPNLFIRAVQGDATSVTGNIYFKFEGVNDAPTITVPSSPVDVPAGAEFDMLDQATVTDPDMCNETICGLPFSDPGMRENDDELLIVAWIPEASCGTFTFFSGAGLTNLGGAARPTVHDVLRAWTGFQLNDVEQDVAADAIAASIESTLSPTAVGLDLSSQPSGLSTPTTALAGTGDLSGVRYALEHIEYHPPTDDATCHLNVNVSDLGNNGAPSSYVGSPHGPEEPFVANPNGNDVPYEVPDAKADVKSIEFNVKDTHPEVTVEQTLPGPLGSPAGPNKPASFTVTFSEPVSGFDNSDLDFSDSTASGATGSVLPSLDDQTFIVNATADDDNGNDIILKIPAGAANAVAAPSDTTEASTSSDNSIEWDQVGPTVTIDKKSDAPAQDDPTSGASVVFTVEFSDTISTAPIGFDASDVDVSTSTTGAGTHVSNVTQPSLIDLKKYEVTVTGMTVPGDVIATVNAGAIVDTALNGSQASTSTDNSVAWVLQPTASIDDVSLNEGNGGTTSFNFTVSLSGPAVGNESVLVDTSNGVVNGATANVDYVPLTSQLVTFAPGDTSKPVTVLVNGDLNFEADEVFNLTLSNPQNLVIGDGSGIGTIQNDDPTNFVSVGAQFAAEGDSGTTGLPFVLTLTSPAGIGDSVVVTPTSGTATAGVDFDATPQTVNFNPGDTVKIVTINVFGDTAPELDEDFSVALSSPVNMVSTGPGLGQILNDDVEVAISATTSVTEGAAGSLDLSISPATHEQFFVRVSTGGGTATSDVDYNSQTMVSLSVPADATSVQVPFSTLDDDDVEGPETFAVSIDPPASQAPNFTVRVNPASDSGTVTIQDNDVPSAMSVSDAVVTEGAGTDEIAVTMTNSTGHTCSATVTSTNGSAVAPGDFAALVAVPITLDNTGTGSVPVTVVDDPDSEGTESFTVTMTVTPDANCAAGDVTATVLIQDNEVVDNTAPDVTIAKAALQPDPTPDTPILFDVDFSEDVLGFDAGDVQFGTPPTGATLSAVVTGGPQHYQLSVSVSGATATGPVQVSIPAAAAKDASSNDSTASNQATVTFLVDAIPPTVSIAVKSGQANPTNASPVMFTVTFSEDVTGFDVGTDVSLSGSANPTTAVITPVSASVYDVSVTGMAGTGTVIATVGGSKATDLAGNPNTAAASPAQIDFDNVAPTVTINQAAGQADPTSSPSINFTVVFSEAVTGFASDHVALSGTAGATTADITGSGTTYNVAVSGMTQSGTVIAAVLAGAAHDAVGNLDAASSSSDNTVQFNKPVDNTPPTVTIDQAAAQSDPTVGPQVTFTAVFSEAVGGFTGGDVVVSGTAGATAATVTDTGDHMHFDVVVTNMLHSGTVIVSIPSGAATDAALNGNLVSTSTDNTVTFNEAVINMSTPGGTVTVTVTQGGVLNSAGTQALQVPAPNGVTFPFGQLSFTATGPAGGLVTFQLQLPSAVNDYYKLVSNAWQQFTFDGETGAVISNGGTTITVTIRDNGRGDSDPTAGVMTDPAAPAVVAQVPPTTTTTTTAPTTSPTTTPGALPPTGSSSTDNLIVVATLLIGLGCLLAGARRRQSKSAKA